MAEMTIEDVKICNCAGCRAELLGRHSPQKALALIRLRDRGEPVPVLRVAGRILGRPYCQSCLSVKDAELYKPFRKKRDRSRKTHQE